MNAAYHRFASIEGSAGAIETDFINHTGRAGEKHPFGYLPGRLRVRRGTGNSVPLEEIESEPGSGFRFAAEAFAQLVSRRDPAAEARLAQASIDTAATLEALARSARAGQAEAIG
jgi:hypothetical protein